MNNPLKALSTEAGLAAEESGHIIPLKFVIYKTGNSAGESPRFGLADFKADLEAGEKGLSEYLLVGILAILAHVYLIQNFQDNASHEEVLTPVKTPPMVQITLVPPEPPKPIVQPPPPPPPPPPKKVEPIKKAEPPPPKKDVVALKPKPPKPRPAPKPVERVVEREEPTPEPSRVVDDAPPVKSAPPAPPAPPVEKVTPPSASAGYLHNPAPEYPAIAEEEGWSGRVVLKVHVMANGRPDNVTVAKSSGHEVLDQAAVHTVLRSWHFAPAKRGETPIDGWVSVPIVFNNPG